MAFIGLLGRIDESGSALWWTWTVAAPAPNAGAAANALIRVMVRAPAAAAPMRLREDFFIRIPTLRMGKAALGRQGRWLGLRGAAMGSPPPRHGCRPKHNDAQDRGRYYPAFRDFCFFSRPRAAAFTARACPASSETFTTVTHLTGATSLTLTYWPLAPSCHDHSSRLGAHLDHLG